MEPELRRIIEIERASYRAYERKLWEFFDARDELGRMVTSWNPIPAEEIAEKRAEVEALDMEQWNAWKNFKMVQRDCRTMEYEFHHPPGIGKEEL